MNARKTHILIVGAGHGGAALIELFHESPTIEISGIVDIDRDAPGMKLAGELGIPTSDEYLSFLKNSRIDEIVNVTGSERVQQDLAAVSGHGVEVIGGHSAELMWRLVEERKRYETALRESEKGYRTLVEGANQPIFKVDTGGRVVFVNRYSAGILGGGADEFKGRTVWELLPHEVARTLMKGVNSAISGGKKIQKHIEPPKDGDQRWYDVVIQPLSNEDGVVDTALVIGMDVTETKKTEKNLFILNETLLALGQDFGENLRLITRACAEIMGAECVLYNRIDGEQMCTLGEWNRPADMELTGKVEDHICCDVIGRGEKGKPFIVKDLQNSRYAGTDPNIRKYGFKMYLGYPVCRYDECVGSLCVIYARDVSLDENELKVVSILADAISREEDRDSAIQALRESERDYRQLFDNAADLIAVVDTKGNFIDLNKRFEEESGYSKEEMLGRNIVTTGIMTGMTAAKAMKYLLDLLRGREIPIFEVDGVRKDGGIVNYEIRAVPLRKDGRVVAVQAILRNISDRKKAEAEVREAKDYLDKIINSIADPIFVKDTDHKWMLLNDAYCQFMGYKREELIGKSEYDFFPKEEADIFWEKDNAVFYTGRENINEEKFTDASGKTHTIITKKTLYVDNAGERILVGIIRDITERKKFEEELQRQRELLDNIISTAPYYVFWKNAESV